MKTTMYEIDFLGNGGLKPVQDSLLQVGQIFFLNGYGQDQFYHERKAVYEITRSSYDNKLQYKYVNLDKPSKGIVNAWEIKHIDRLFGIGLYYIDNQFATPEEITEALQLANDAELRAEDLRRINEIETDLVKERGLKLIKNNWPKQEPIGVIVAELKQNECDYHTDYFHASTSRTVILAFTFKKQNDFNELRKACLNCDIPEIRKYAERPTVDHNGREKTEQNKSYWHPADENRENYSGGSGYYLGEHSYSGWHIRKDTYHKIETYAYDAGKNNGFYAFKPEDKKPVKVESTAAKTEPVNTSVDGLELLDYSDKAFAVFGNTKAVKDILKELGGRFNPALTHPNTKQKQAGWIFSKKVREVVKQELGL